MSGDVISVRTTDALIDAIRTLSKNHISGAPVLDETNNLKGVISEADILKLIEYQPSLIPFLELLEDNPDDITDAIRIASKKRVDEIMSKPAIVVNENRSASDAASLMWSKKINRLPVLDNKNNLVGIITRADLLKAFL